MKDLRAVLLELRLELTEEAMLAANEGKALNTKAKEAGERMAQRIDALCEACEKMGYYLGLAHASRRLGDALQEKVDG